MRDQYAHIPAHLRFHSRSSDSWITGFLLSKSNARCAGGSLAEDVDEAVASVDHAISPECRCYAMYANDHDEQLVAISLDCPIHRTARGR